MRFFQGLLLIGAFSVLSGCQTAYKEKPKPTAESAKAKKTLAEIKKSAGKKPLTETVRELKDLIRQSRGNKPALEAQLFLARLFEKKGKTGQACRTYEKAMDRPYSHDLQDTIALSTAQCLIQQNKTIKALELLETRIQKQDKSLKIKYQSAQLQWSAIKNKNNVKSWKIKTLSHLISASPLEKEKLLWEKKAEELLSKLNYKEAVSLKKESENYGLLQGAFLFKAGEISQKEGQPEEAERLFKKALSSHLSPSRQKEARKRLKILSAHSKVNPYIIGVILPLSGRRRALGEKSLRGLYAGLELTQDSPWQMIIMDSKDHPDVVKTNMEKLFYKHHVMAVVGGLSGETAEVMAEKADEFGLPCILFSQKSDLTKNRGFVFQNAQAGKSLVRRLIEDIESALNLKKTAILYPEDSYGKEYARIFTEMFTERGGKISKQVSYKRDEVDFKQPLKSLFEFNNREEEYKKLKEEYLKKHPGLTARSKKLSPERILQPKKDFEAIFIPDSLSALKKIIAYLKYFDIEDLYILGTNLWKPDRLPAVPEGLPVIFVSADQMEPKDLSKSSFHTWFTKTFHSVPGFFERQSFNAAQALIKALKTSPKTRSQLNRELKKIKTVQGAFFPITLSEDRVFSYPLETYISSGGNLLPLKSRPARLQFLPVKKTP